MDEAASSKALIGTFRCRRKTWSAVLCFDFMSDERVKKTPKPPDGVSTSEGVWKLWVLEFYDLYGKSMAIPSPKRKKKITVAELHSP